MRFRGTSDNISRAGTRRYFNNHFASVLNYRKDRVRSAVLTFCVDKVPALSRHLRFARTRPSRRSVVLFGNFAGKNGLFR
jgi:hypothetical protein